MFALTEQKVLMHYNPRSEFEGKTARPAATLTFKCSLPVDQLAMFSPTLRSSLYHNPMKETNGGSSPVDGANVPRYPQITNSLKWNLEVVGGTLTIHYGATDDSDIVLPVTKADNFDIEPDDEGKFNLSFRVAVHPDEAQSGKLAFMQDTEQDITFEPPAHSVVGDLADQGAQQEAATAGA